MTHCGILWTVFQGRIFYLKELYPSHVTARFSQPFSAGAMTLLTPHLAEFRTEFGDTIDFVDEPPGVVGAAYPFQVHVLSGGNTLIDERFAGRTWHPSATIPGVTGLPYGNGLDRLTAVDGTFTILSTDHATFRSQGRAVVPFTAIPPGGCD